MICPYCMQDHAELHCPTKRMDIPPAYARLVKSRTPVFFVMAIGYSGHGKTSFLSALFYSLYHGLAHSWPNFSFLAINQKSLDRIHREFVQMLEKNLLPPKTPIMFPEPLMLRMQGIPMVKSNLIFKKMVPSDAIFTFYDIGGGTFEFGEKIEENVPLLTRSETVLFLVDIANLVKDGGYQGAEKEWHRLLNVYFNSIKDSSRKPSLVIAFTKADLMTNDEKFGPLSTWQTDEFHDDIPFADQLMSYLNQAEMFSQRIEYWVSEFFPMVHNTIQNNVKKVYFTTFSALGGDPTKGKLEKIQPKRVLDPLLLTMLAEGFYG